MKAELIGNNSGRQQKHVSARRAQHAGCILSYWAVSQQGSHGIQPWSLGHALEVVIRRLAF